MCKSSGKPWFERGLHKTLKKTSGPLGLFPTTLRISADDFTSNTLLDPVLIRAIPLGAWVGALKVDEEIDEYKWSTWSMMIVDEKTPRSIVQSKILISTYSNSDPHASGLD